MPLKNMKITEKEAKEDLKPSKQNLPRYPWGLSINLDNDTLAKLGITDLPEAGAEMSIIANAKVESTGEDERADGKKNRRMTLQITEMAIEGKLEKSTLDTIYGDDKK